MEIRHIRAVIAVADAHSVRKAAVRLHVAQSALSRTIRDLEREIGVGLFQRSTHGVQLSKAGERFLEGGRRTLAEANAAIARARDARAGGVGPIVIGIVNPELRPAWIGSVLERFRAAMPDMAVHLESMPSIAMAEAATQRVIDVGLGYDLAPTPGTTVSTVFQDTLAGIIIARTHPLSQRQSVSIFDLESYPFLWSDPTRNPPMHERVFGAFRHIGFTPKYVPALGQVDASAATAFALVSSGFGWALYPTAARSAVPATLRYVPLRDVSIPLPTDLLTRADDRSVCTRAFHEIVTGLAAGDDGAPAPAPASR